MNQLLILMATYNGSKYLSEQIESIIAQSYKDWKLVISDDGSSDGTVEIIEKYCKDYPDKITRFNHIDNYRSPSLHFLELLKNNSCANYVMFCDQDDIWHTDKIEKTMNLMLEEENGDITIPVLVHTDLNVVDEKMNLIEKSMISNRKLNLKNRLVTNNVTGCTVMINKALADYSNKYLLNYKDLKMHDWYLGIIAEAFGKVSFLNEGTINYRQHGNNACGSPMGKKHNAQLAKKNFDLCFEQAKIIYDSFKEILPTNKSKILYNFVKLRNKNKILKVWGLVKGKYTRNNFISTLRMLIIC